MRTVGAAAAGGALLPGQAAALIGDLDTETDALQEVLVVFESVDDIGLLGDLDLAEGYYGFSVLPIAYTKLTGTQIETVAALPAVRTVAENRELEFEHDDARPDTRASEVQTGDGLEAEYTGENAHVAVIDSGIDGSHPDLEGNLEANWRWIGDPLSDPDGTLWEDLGPVNTDDNGHGTHCSGSVGADGTESDGEFRGMAPDVTLTSYSTGLSLTIVKPVAAYDHLLSRQRDGEVEVHVASNSFGAGPGEFDPDGPLVVATWKAHEAGIVVTFSAGNDGPDDGTQGTFKQAPHVLSVGATHDDQSVTDFSSRGTPGANHDREEAYDNLTEYFSGVAQEEIDGPLGLFRNGVVAKGADVMSTLNPTHPLGATGDDTEVWYGLLSGTSMSNPVTAGCAALVIDAYVESHGSVPDPIAVINTLEATADPGATDGLDDPAGDGEYSVENVGAGYVDALAAVERAEADDLAGFDDVTLVDE